MISYELSAYCFALGGAALAIVTLVLELVARALGVRRTVPTAMLEPSGPSWHILNFLMEALFFVVIPTLAYSYFHVALPLAGIRPALAAALLAFSLGAMPAIMGLSVRLKLPMPYMLFFLFSILLKLASTLAVIGYLHTL